MFTDPDGDNIPTAHEWFRGYDPTKFDTNGDGLFDGAEDAPKGSTPLPLDGRTVCLPRIGVLPEDDKDEDRSTYIEIVGVSYEGAQVIRTSNVGPTFALERPIDPSLLTQYLKVTGESIRNDRCHDTERGLLMSSKARTNAATLIAPHLTDAIVRVEEAIGLDVGRRSYRLSRSTTSMQSMEWMVKKNHLPSLALLVVVDEVMSACNAVNTPAFRDLLYDRLGGVSVAKVGFGGFGPDRAALMQKAEDMGGIANYVKSHCSRLDPEA